MRRYQAFHTRPEPKPGFRGILRQLFVGTDIYWGDKLEESIGRRESAGYLWRQYISHPIRRKVNKMNLDFDKLTEAWNEIPSYRKRSMIRAGVVTLSTIALTTYESRKYGFKTAIRPRLLWNLPKERQKVYYIGLLVQLLARDLQNSRNEAELKRIHNGARKLADDIMAKAAEARRNQASSDG